MKKIIYLFILLFVVSSCTKLSLGYKFGTSTFKSRLYDSFEFSNRDKIHQINKHFDEAFVKNKKPFFNILKTLLTRMQEGIRAEVSLDAVQKLHVELVRAQKEVVEIYSDSFSVVFNLVNGDELESYKKYVEEKHLELLADSKNLNKFKSKKIKNFERAFDFFLDDITDEQLELVKKFIDENESYYLNQVNIRHKYNQDLIALYPNKEKMKNLSIAYFGGDSSIRSAVYQKERLVFEDNMKRFVVKVYKSLTVKQKAFLEERLFELIQDVEGEINE